MAFDASFYYSLMPFLLAYRWVAGSILLAGFFIHWVIGAVKAQSDTRKGLSSLWDGVLVLIVFTLLYMPHPHPGNFIGGWDDDFLAESQYPETTFSLFILERLSFGLDNLMVSILSFDTGVRATSSLEAQDLPGAGIHVDAPNAGDVLYQFVIQRGEFVISYAKTLFAGSQESGEDGDNRFGANPLGAA